MQRRVNELVLLARAEAGETIALDETGEADGVAVEAAVELGWERYIGLEGRFIGMHSFGASGPGPEVYKHFGITVDAVINAVKQLA